MRLENLYKNFGTSTPEEQAEFMAAYRLRRAQDLERVPTIAKRKPSTSASRSKFDLSDNEKRVMKLLGLKQKDIIALREVAADTEDDNGEDLFKDELFEDAE